MTRGRPDRKHFGLSLRGARAVVGIGVVVVLVGAGFLVTAAGAEAEDAWPLVLDYGVGDPANRTCDEIGADLVAQGYLASSPDWDQVKVEPPANGEYDAGELGTIVISSYDASSHRFDWALVEGTGGVDLVYVKSGSAGARLYLYDPPREATSGTGLESTQAISHISFCWDAGGGTTTTTRPTTSTTGPTTSSTGPTTSSTGPTTSSTGPTTSSTGPTTSTTGPTTSTTGPTTSTTGPTTSTAVQDTTVTQDQTTTPTAAVLGVQQEKGELPRTGFAVGTALLLAGALLVLGGGLSWAAHRREAPAG
jgi:hypothetical protein